MSTDRFHNFCIVGLGGHARTKLIPAILANGQSVVAAVSSQPAASLPGLTVYPNLHEAVDRLPLDTVFFISTPPPLHFRQAETILKKGFDLFLEKPCFVTRPEAEQIASICMAGSAVLVEAFMHRYTTLYAEFMAHCAAPSGQVVGITIKFLIDKMPAGTFRSQGTAGSSSLYDIGCYPLSLLADMGLGHADLRVTDVLSPDDPDNMQVRLAGTGGDTSIDIEIGVGNTYENFVSLDMTSGENVRFSPFFYGRNAERSIATTRSGDTRTRKFPDANAFQRMLSLPRSAWKNDQAERLVQMIETTSRLESLSAIIFPHQHLGH